MSRAVERSTITAVLKRIDLKVRFNRALQHLSIAMCVVLGVLLLGKVAPLLVPVSVPSGVLIVSLGSAAFVAFFLWSQLGHRQLERAAGVADLRAGLNDEIKSAYWFLRQDDSSPWIDVLVGRASETARRLDPRRLVPIAIPRRFGIALLLFGLLQAMAFVPSDGPLLTFAAASDSTRFERAREAYAEELRDMIDGEGDEILDEDALAMLEAALEELEAAETGFDELLRDLREAQDAFDEGNLEMAATRDALDELAQEFSESAELADFVDALESQELSDAGDLLRDLAEGLGDLSGEELADLAELLQQASQLDQPVLDQLLEALEEAAAALSEDRINDAEEALQQAADQIDQITDRSLQQQANNDASERTQSLQEAMSQQLGSSPGDPEGQTAQSTAGGDQTEASTASPSSEITRSDGAQPSGQTGPAGNSTGDPSGGDLDLGASTTLAAQLELEIIDGSAPEEEQPELDPEDLFQEASRQQGSITQYRDVQAPSQYSRGSALNAERIPWRYRSLVKDYFLAIRPAPHNAPGRYNFDETRPDERK